MLSKVRARGKIGDMRELEMSEKLGKRAEVAVAMGRDVFGCCVTSSELLLAFLPVANVRGGAVGLLSPSARREVRVIFGT